jgi:hypothetical protein
MLETIQGIIRDDFLNQTTNKFYIEGQIKYKLALELFVRAKVECILEYRIPGHDPGERNSYLDILALHQGNQYGIELKYKTRNRINADYVNQGAQNNGKYDYMNDLLRLETFKDQGYITTGYAILLTNDPSYWRAARQGAAVAEFNLISGEYTRLHYTPRWKGRTVNLNFENQYPIQWQNQNQAKNDGNTFAYLVIEV